VPRYALELVEAPPFVTVTFKGGASRLEVGPGRYVLGLVEDADVRVQCATQADWKVLSMAGWGGRKNTILSVSDAERWFVEHAGHGGRGPFVNGEGLALAPRELFPGDLLAPADVVVFRLVEVEPVREPPALLDAVAEAPDDLGRWHVLADWLSERQAPHALMAAYELKLEAGTNDPELIGDYAAVRRARLALPTDVHFSALTWRCGYVVSCSLGLGPRDRYESERLTRGLGQPQLSALSELTILATGTESAPRLESVLGALPRTVRTVGLHFSGAVPMPVLGALHRRPPKAHAVRLQLAEPLGPLRPLVELLAAAGWTTIDLGGTRLTERVGEIATLVRSHSGVTFVLGGTSLPADSVPTVEGPNVQWAPSDAEALAVDVDTGALWPISRARGGFVWGLPLEPLGREWLFRGPGHALDSGDTFRGAGRRYVFLRGDSLDAAYRAWVERALAER
jgi:uncharacterized protein (TIGR02996 family)